MEPKGRKTGGRLRFAVRQSGGEGFRLGLFSLLASDVRPSNHRGDRWSNRSDEDTANDHYRPQPRQRELLKRAPV